MDTTKQKTLSSTVKWGLTVLALLIGVLLGGCPLTEDPIAQAPCEIPEGVLLVDQANDSGEEDGLSWASAYTSVQAAVDAAGPGEEVWVAAGTYKSGGNETVLTMAEGVAVLGGFSGDECSSGDRDWVANLTVLSGDTTDDGWTADDSYHVVVGASDARLSGFRVTGGNADSPTPGFDRAAGAMLNMDVSNLQVDRVIFDHHYSYGNSIFNYNTDNLTFERVLMVGGVGRYASGGIGNFVAGTVTVNNAAFVDNVGGASSGGGMRNSESTLHATNVTFARNTNSSAGGFTQWKGSATIIGATFSENKAFHGGAIDHQEGSLTIVNATFSRNTAYVEAGAILLKDIAEIAHVSFVSNEANTLGSEDPYDYGGAVYAFESTSTVVNSAFYDNLQYDGETPTASDLVIEDSTVTVSYTCNETGLSGTGNVTLAGLPFETPTDSHATFLDPAGAATGCIDAGDNVAADSTIGEGLWEAQTTRADGQTESDIDGAGSETVDAGRHYDPFAVRIDAFSADGANITWTSTFADSCFLFNDTNHAMATIPASDLDGGTIAHEQESGTELFLICMGSAGEPAVATAIIP